MVEAPRPEAKCVHCGGLVDGYADVEFKGNDPSPGDPAVCIHCGGVQVFDDDLSFRKPRPDEECEIFTDDAVIRAVRAVNAFRAEREARASEAIDRGLAKTRGAYSPAEADD